MTQDEVLDLVRAADGQVTMWVNHSTIQKTTTLTFESPIDYYVSGKYHEMYHIKFVERFAKLVAAKEREACAKVADGWPDYDVQGLAEAIRARGQA